MGSTPVSSWSVVQELLKSHGEYGNHQGSVVALTAGPGLYRAQSARAWVDQVNAILAPSVKELHGRLLILGLARLDAPLDGYLTFSGFLRAVEEELSEGVETQFRPGLARHPAVHDPTFFHADGPAIRDALGRQGFAATLAVRLRRIWREHVDSGTGGSFVVHLHGPWGSGKTSLLGMLSRVLGEKLDGQGSASNQSLEPSAWLVVTFNAWQQQRHRPAMVGTA